MPLPSKPKKRGDMLSSTGPTPKLAKKTAPRAPKVDPSVGIANIIENIRAEAIENAKKLSAPISASAKAGQKLRAAEKVQAPKKKATLKKTTAKTRSQTAKHTAAPAAAKPAVKPASKAGSANAGLSASVADTLSSAPNPQMLQTGRRGRASTPDNLKKLFVLDTNVLMHDPLCIFHFAEHDVFLPMTVLEELDNHKKGTSDVARNARTVSRSLDTMMEVNGADLSDGVPLSLLGNKEAGGRLYFETHNLADEIPEDLPTFKGDNRILAVVRGVIKAFPERGVVLVSKDINMRIKATALGIPAEDYLSDKVLDDTDLLYSGKLAMPADFWQTHAEDLESWQDAGSTHYRFKINNPGDFVINQCLSIEGDPDFMAIVTAKEADAVTMRLLKDYRTRLKVWGIQARNAEQNMALNLLMDPDIDFVTLLGQAGTGKTLMTLAAALTQTMDERRFSEIIVTRATVSVGEDIGFLPGTEEEKMAPWMGALEDNLEVLQRTDDSMGGDWGRQATMDLIKTRIRVKSMSFMRGRTFLKKFVIIDEAQNLSPKQMKTLITRAGPGTKIVCLGNIAQIDTPYLTEGSSGLTYVVERFQGWNHAATITLTRGERSRLADYATEVL